MLLNGLLLFLASFSQFILIIWICRKLVFLKLPMTRFEPWTYLAWTLPTNLILYLKEFRGHSYRQWFAQIYATHFYAFWLATYKSQPIGMFKKQCSIKFTQKYLQERVLLWRSPEMEIFLRFAFRIVAT